MGRSGGRPPREGLRRHLPDALRARRHARHRRLPGSRRRARRLLRATNRSTRSSRAPKAKPGHVLQLCFYAEAIAALTGRAPPRACTSGSARGRTESLRRRGVHALLAAASPPARRAARRRRDARWRRGRSRASSCEYCEFQGHCEAQWRAEDSLAFVAERPRRASATPSRPRACAPWSSSGPARARRCRRCAKRNDDGCTRQAALQVASREAPEAPPRLRVHRGDAKTRSTGTASSCCPSPTTATSSSTSRATRSGRRSTT